MASLNQLMYTLNSDSIGLEFLNPSIMVSLTPSVSLKNNSVACETRVYLPAMTDEKTLGFLSLRVSTRKNVGLGVGYKTDFGLISFGTRFGGYTNADTNTMKPYYGINIGFNC